MNAPGFSLDCDSSNGCRYPGVHSRGCGCLDYGCGLSPDCGCGSSDSFPGLGFGYVPRGFYPGCGFFWGYGYGSWNDRAPLIDHGLAIGSWI